MTDKFSLQTVSPNIAASSAPQVRLRPVDSTVKAPDNGNKVPRTDSLKPEKRQTLAELTQTVEALNIKAQQVQRRLEFRVDEASGRTIVTVRDKETGEVIRQIPPEEMIEIGQRLRALTEEILGDKDVSGLLVKKQA